MKMLSWHYLATLVASINLVRADRRGHLRAGARTDGSQKVWRLDSDLVGSKSKNADHGQTDDKIALHASLESMVAEMLRGKGPKLNAIVKVGHSKIQMTDAVKQLDGKLPNDVAALVRLTAASGQNAKRAAFDENSMQKARRILNGMIYAAWLELDDVVFECKEFQERNRGAYEQVVNDLARLGSQLAKLGENRVSASQGIMKADSERKEAEEKLSIRTQEFTAKRFENSREMSVRKNDLAVFDFILMATQCKDNAFVQLDSKSKSSPKMKICNTNDGLELNFEDHQLQAKIERMMTPEARLALREALGQAVGPLNLVQLRQAPAVNDSETTTVLPTYAAKVVPVKEKPHPQGQWKKCLDGTPNCGLLHDLMSLEWGKFRDSFDELTAEMNKNQQEFDNFKRNVNDELTVINDEKTKQMEILANTISSINADTEELNEKDEQKRALTEEFDKTCKIFREKIAEILFTKICAVRKVRNELLVNSALTPPSNLSDCDFSDWVSKTGECFAPNGDAILCDDTCPQRDPFKCGGSEVMKRDVVVAPDANGMKCPPLQRSKKCMQKKCEVNCVMSEWSGWSKCTKDCEGGIQAKTRSIITKPKNGGTGCDAVQEDRPCNTGSCDRDCSLVDWTKWEPCSVACGGGITTRARKVLVPIRGQGKCPTEKSGLRLEEKTCNDQACIGDETCIAKQDLIIMLDASGSLKEDGFAILRNFTANLTTKYQAKYFGANAMKIGLAVFGNGKLNSMKDGTTTIQSAINAQSLTTDLTLVNKKILNVKWQRGFTNMAQGFIMCDGMLSRNGRADAQSSVLVISDGKYSFKYQTAEKARELKDKNVQIFMAPVTEFQGKELETLKQWASQPWETNYERIPGLAALKYNAAIFMQKLVVKFCSDAFSPSLMLAKENQRQYMLIREGAWPSDECGEWTYIGVVGNKDDCAAEARNEKRLSFAWGKDEKNSLGKCYTEVINVTQEYWNKFKFERQDPPCPGVNGGEWLENPYFDTYIINPRTV